MSKFKNYLMCKIFGHQFIKIKDLRKTSFNRKRVVYRCSRCGQPLVTRGSNVKHNSLISLLSGAFSGLTD